MGYNVVRCSAEKCIHNMNGMCSAQKINITGELAKNSNETNCRTFEPRDYRTSITNISNINISGVVDQIFTEEPVMNPAIRCEAVTCVYNKNLICTANQIQVNGPYSTVTHETQCETFKQR